MSWWKKYRNANKETKNFLVATVIFGVSIVVTTVYCYARLDFVRSGPRTNSEQQEHPTNSDHF